MHAVSPRTPMTINEARSTIWPFRDYRGQAIGHLLDHKAIALKDLGFAAQRAYDKRVRDAARTLLLYALTQPNNLSISPGPLNVVASERRSFSERRQLLLFFLEGLLFGGVMGALIVLFFVSIFSRDASNPAEATLFESLTDNNPAAYFAVAVLIVLCIATFFMTDRVSSWVSNRFERAVKRHRKGQLGEERCLNVLYNVLDGNWWLFRNLEFSGQRRGDIDMVLVGPTGVWSFEIKSFDGEFRTVGEQWERRLGTRWVTALKNPTQQVKRNAVALNNMLRTHDINQWITPVIIWANPESALVVQNPEVPVWKIDELAEKLGNLHGKAILPSDKQDKIIEVLQSMYQEPWGG